MPDAIPELLSLKDFRKQAGYKLSFLTKACPKIFKTLETALDKYNTLRQQHINIDNIDPNSLYQSLEEISNAINKAKSGFKKKASKSTKALEALEGKVVEAKLTIKKSELDKKLKEIRAPKKKALDKEKLPGLEKLDNITPAYKNFLENIKQPHQKLAQFYESDGKVRVEINQIKKFSKVVESLRNAINDKINTLQTLGVSVGDKDHNILSELWSQVDTVYRKTNETIGIQEKIDKLNKDIFELTEQKTKKQQSSNTTSKHVI